MAVGVTFSSIMDYVAQKNMSRMQEAPIDVEVIPGPEKIVGDVEAGVGDAD